MTLHFHRYFWFTRNVPQADLGQWSATQDLYLLPHSHLQQHPQPKLKSHICHLPLLPLTLSALRALLCFYRAVSLSTNSFSQCPLWNKVMLSSLEREVTFPKLPCLLTFHQSLQNGEAFPHFLSQPSAFEHQFLIMGTHTCTNPQTHRQTHTHTIKVFPRTEKSS